MAIPIHHPHTMHLEPYHLNDSFRGMRIGIRRKFKFFDQDCNCDADGTFWIKHWGVPRMDGFIYLIGPGKLRKRDPHPHKPIAQRSSTEMRRLRRKRVGGGRYRTAAEHANYLGSKGKIMCLEAKGSKGFHNVENWKRFKSELNPNATVYVMTLTNIKGWRKRVKAAHEAGFEVAVLPRGRKPADWGQYAGWVKVWGGWHK